MERKEAIEVIKKKYPHCAESGTQFETALRTLIPELKESEDERIRKHLIEDLKWRLNRALDQDANGCDRQKDIEAYKWGIAWLEKQAPKPKWTEEDEENFRDIIGAIHRVAYQTSGDEKARIKWIKSIKQKLNDKRRNGKCRK